MNEVKPWVRKDLNQIADCRVLTKSAEIHVRTFVHAGCWQYNISQVSGCGRVDVDDDQELQLLERFGSGCGCGVFRGHIEFAGHRGGD